MASSRPKFPSAASEFRRSHLDSLYISYSEATSDQYADTLDYMPLYKWFFKHVGLIKTGDNGIGWWNRLDKHVSTKQSGSATGKFLDIDKASCDRLHDIFRSRARPRGSAESDTRFLEKLLATLSEARCKAVDSRFESFVLKEIIEYESLGKVIRFIEILHTMISKMVMNGSYCPKEAAFVNLFERFAHLCELNISPGDVDTRRMDVMGTRVTSAPDVQFGKKHENEYLVVTVGEIKRGQKDDFDDPEQFTLQLRGGKRTKATDEEVEEGSKRLKVDEEEDVAQVDEEGDAAKVEEEGEDAKGYGSKLKGQHGAELLLELPYSAMREYGNQDRVFGFIVQATKVRLTCLQMKKEHLEKIQKNEDLGLADNAIIYYTRPYDFLYQPEREELERVLLALSHMARE